jgi:ubiquinone/menaquinone biosynthesis C-methylase UbiE
VESSALYRLGAGVRPHCERNRIRGRASFVNRAAAAGSGQSGVDSGRGTGLDLPHLPSNADVTAVDVTPAMLKRLDQRAASTRQSVTTRIMDARQLAFPDSSFDAV